MAAPNEDTDFSEAMDAETIPPGRIADNSEDAATILPSDIVGKEASESASDNGPVDGRHDGTGQHRLNIRYFGDYELCREIARGGMGVVYEARQVNLNRRVALKMILSGQLASQEDVRRFYLEAEAAANLAHPGIVPIHEIGQHEGQHFYAMGFIEGQSLQDRIGKGPLPPREAAELMIKVAEAIHHAHEKGVIHRDLKPANILLDHEGAPRVTDFGLARKLEEDSGLTKTGAVMGTPSYMPPEQAAGKSSEVGTLSDVYSLGAILYCLLTGRPPFQADNPLDTLLQVLEKEPVSPVVLNPRVPRDLDTVCLKCLTKDPAKRYQSAIEFAKELHRWCEGMPIKARAVTKAEICWRWVKRNPLISSLAASILAILAASSIVAGSLAYWAINESEKSRLAADELGVEKERARQSQYFANVNLAHQHLASSDTQAVERTLKELIPGEGDADFRDFEYFYLQNTLADYKRLRTLWSETGVAGDSEQFFAALLDHINPYATSGILGDVLALAVSGDDHSIAYCDMDGRVFIRTVEEAESLAISADSPIPYCHVTFDTKGKMLVGAGANGTATIWNVADASVMAEFTGHTSGVVRVQVSPDDRLLATGCWDGSVYVWEIATKKLICRHEHPQVKESNHLLDKVGTPRSAEFEVLSSRVKEVDTLLTPSNLIH